MPGDVSTDEDRIDEGRKLAQLCMRKAWAHHRDFAEVTIVLVHESAAKMYEHVVRQGARAIGGGWVLMPGDRSHLPPEAAATMPTDRLPLLIAAGKLHLLTSIGHDELVSTKGGSA
jgi:hypothetical protein